MRRVVAWSACLWLLACSSACSNARSPDQGARLPESTSEPAPAGSHALPAGRDAAVELDNAAGQKAPPPPPPPPSQMGDGGLRGPPCATLEARARAREVRRTDMVWVVDNSLGMQRWSGGVRDGLNALSQSVAERGLDPSIVMISGNSDWTAFPGVCVPAPLGSGRCPDDSNEPGYLHVDKRRVETDPPVEELLSVRVTNPLEMLMNTFDSWRHVLRPFVSKSFVIVTDADSHVTAQYFREWMARQPELRGHRWSMSGIYCTERTGPCDADSHVGSVYDELIGESAGARANIADPDVSSVLDAIAANVVDSAEPLPCELAIPEPPDGMTLDPSQINVRHTSSDGFEQTLYGVRGADDCELGGSGWYYDDPEAPTRILTCAATCDVLRLDPGAAIDIGFGCERELVPVL